MNYRNKKVLAEARNHPCQACKADDGTVVAAHSNQQRHGKGLGIKAHDVFVAYLCAACHTYVDQGSGSKQQRHAVWEDAHEASIPLFDHLLNEEAERLLLEAQPEYA